MSSVIFDDELDAGASRLHFDASAWEREYIKSSYSRLSFPRSQIPFGNAFHDAPRHTIFGQRRALREGIPKRSLGTRKKRSLGTRKKLSSFIFDDELDAGASRLHSHASAWERENEKNPDRGKM